MNRQEHMDWCKERALEYVDKGDVQNAWASMVSDIGKHDETRGHPALEMGTLMFMQGALKNPEEMRDFINGFN